MATIIADCGSTKTDWWVADQREKSKVGDDLAALGRHQQTPGMNPVHQSDEEIDEELRHAASLLQVSEGGKLHFYGAGVLPSQRVRMASLLQRRFTGFCVEAESDLLGAARALCGHAEGMACILGTGSNSCLFDGENIVQNISPMGYILGDEGSGAVLGRLFLGALYKGGLPGELRATFEEETGLSLPIIINKVYRQPMANRFLASLSHFVARHLDVQPLEDLVIENFRTFLRRNVALYHRKDLAVNAVGSMAFVYGKQFAKAAEAEGFQTGLLAQSPLEGLQKYHLAASS